MTVKYKYSTYILTEYLGSNLTSTLDEVRIEDMLRIHVCIYIGRLFCNYLENCTAQIVSELDGCANLGPFADLGRIKEIVVMSKASVPGAAARRKFKISWVACPNNVENI